MARAPKEPDGRGRRGPGHTRWLPGSGLALGLQSQCAPASAWPPTSPPSGLCLRGALGAGELSASARLRARPAGSGTPRPRDPGIPGGVYSPALCAASRRGSRSRHCPESLETGPGLVGLGARARGSSAGQCTELERSGRRGQEKTAQPGSPPREQSHGPLRWCVNSGCILALILLSS